MQSFAKSLDTTIKTGIAYEMMMIGFGFYVVFIIMILMTTGMFLGVAQTTR